MNDTFTPCPIDRLLTWAFEEEKTGWIFGIPKRLFFVPKPEDGFKMMRYGKALETPIGVAAGPHTQLSQNIICAWLTGARYIELKTVQTLDELNVTKPCIDMTDEGYNCEWSQELKLEQSFSEYLNAWIILHILKDKFGWGDMNAPGFIFNMSVGYNLSGIMNDNVQRFLDRMANCEKEKTERIQTIVNIYPRVANLDISNRISDNVTLSTMHGCPPDEIEKIGRYFIQERKLHTTIKLNPTLLGSNRVKDILNHHLGFDVDVPDSAFDHDLKYDDAVAIIRTLQLVAESAGVSLGLKLTNTLETSHDRQNLPKDEKMVYMSGRALHPISINLAQRLQNEFNGRLDISFSAGADCFNLPEILACNMRPVTVCSDILKPGGYGRLSQYMTQLQSSFNSLSAKNIKDMILSKGNARDYMAAGLANLSGYARRVIQDNAYQKSHFPYQNIKTARNLTAFDCVEAPCVTTCPVHQNVPLYMYYSAKGMYEKAWYTILDTNPLPHIQGMVCDHPCQFKCTRMNLDHPLRIREIKRFITKIHPVEKEIPIAPPNGVKAAVIGAGPSGLTCAHFLALSGFEVEIFESEGTAGGMASGCIPRFRLDDESIKKDIDRIRSMGVQIHYDNKIDASRFDRLRESHDYIYIAVGAQKGIQLDIPGEDAAGVIDQLQFLRCVKNGNPPDLGNKVVVIGGGNSAVDAARTAKRMLGKTGSVRIVYRRTRNEMPAADEEIKAAMKEDVEIIELSAPDCMIVENGHVVSNVCFKTVLGEKDESGRARPIKIDGSEFHIQADTVISAIGQKRVLDFFPSNSLDIHPETLETRIPGVFAGGDVVRGASTLIWAISDGKTAAESILKNAAASSLIPPDINRCDVDVEKHAFRQARREFGPKVQKVPPDQRSVFGLETATMNEDTARQEAGRCLQCDALCNICAAVCPNRANIVYTVNPAVFPHQQVLRLEGATQVVDIESVHIKQKFQIIHIADFCNGCGNCTTFCPTNGEPHRVKPKFFLSRERFSSETDGFMLAHEALTCKISGHLETLFPKDDSLIYENRNLKASLNRTTYAAEGIEWISSSQDLVDLRHAAEMGIMLVALKNFYLFKTLDHYCPKSES